jgi:predicted phage replisome organizer
MTIAKKYYWLKLKEDFFRQKEIKKLRRIAGGDTYTIIYLKMMLLSLKDEGKLFFEGLEDSFIDEVALEIDEDLENVKVTIMFLLKCGLIEELTENEFLMTKAYESIGSETQSAERVRKFRERKKQQKSLQCNTPVTKCNTEIEIEKDIEIELQQDIEENSCGSSEKDFNIFEYMQQRGFVSISPMVYEKINADIELYSLEEVKKAIDIADSNAKHTYNYVKGILEKRRAGVNEKVEKETDFKKAMKEFLEE